MDVFIKKKCHSCGKKFLSYKCLNRIFCSKSCVDVSEKVNIKCLFCKRVFSLLASQVKAREVRFKVQYCSRVCFDSSRKTQPKHCKFCVVSFLPKRARQIFCSVPCRIKASIKPIHQGWWYENGYKVLYDGNGKGIKEHVYVMQNCVGRTLEKDEVVHHINGVRDNNSIENLKLLKKGEHSRLHRNIEKKKYGNRFGRHRKKRMVEAIYPIEIQER